LSERTPELLDRLLAGELDVAVVPLPDGRTARLPLLTNIIATDRVEIVQVAAGNVEGDWKSLGRSSFFDLDGMIRTGGNRHAVIV
jgi:predicted solute-binding protein